MDILPTNEYVKIDDRAYVNPQVGLDETNSFIDNLRSTQAQQNKEIITDTRNLGTDIPSNLGGLTGAESYFTSRYQIPQTNAVVANLRAVAQADALNQALQNEQALWKKRYQDAYRNYQQSAYKKAYGTNPTNPTNPTNKSGWPGDLELITKDKKDDKKTTPPNPEDYLTEGEKQNKDIQERVKEKTGADMPDWLTNILKIFG